MAKKGLLILRVSTAEQARNGASLESQEDWGRKTASLHGVHIVECIRTNMSGDVFPKEYYEKIINLVKEKEIDHLYVYAIDRLARNLPWGARLIQDLWGCGVQLVTSTLIPNLDEPNDRCQVWLALFMAEFAFGDIHEKTSRGIITKLSKGEYFYDHLPFGYDRVDLKIFLKNEYLPIIQIIFKAFIQKRNYAETARIVNSTYKHIIRSELSAASIKKILMNKIYIGYFTWNGITLGIGGDETKPREELIAIDEDTFYRTQQIIQELGSKYSRKGASGIASLSKWYDEYGMDLLLDHCENLIVCCPRCRSIELIYNGSEISSGTLVRKHQCKNCKYTFRWPSAKQLKRFRSLNPLRCMKCGVPDHFEVTVSQLTDYYLVRCTECDFKSLIPKGQHVFSEVQAIECSKKKSSKSTFFTSKNRYEKNLGTFGISG